MTLADQISLFRNMLDRLDLESMESRLRDAISLCTSALSTGKPILVCGNGGSACDAQHIAGELVGRFKKERRALNVRSLSADSAILTAWANDYSYETVFARQVEAYGQSGGVLVALSTSGNSRNVVAAAEAARRVGMTVIAFTGEGGGRLAAVSDVLLDAPSQDTPRIQELHAMLYHHLCERIETAF